MTRVDEVRRVLNEIVDPCSATAGAPTGILDMGIVESLTVRGTTVDVTLAPTFPGCLFLGVFDREIAERVSGLAWCTGVTVELAVGAEPWDESRMSPGARARLARKRADRVAAGSGG